MVKSSYWVFGILILGVVLYWIASGCRNTVSTLAKIASVSVLLYEVNRHSSAITDSSDQRARVEDLNKQVGKY